MRRRLRTCLAFAVAIALMAFFLRNVELVRVAEAIAMARRDLLALALVLAGAAYVIRAIRWRYLLAPLGAVGFGNALQATTIGFAVTAILPGRVGEVVRPYWLARRERLSASSVFATVVAERVLDLVAILVLFGLSVVVFDPVFVVMDDALVGGLRAGAAMAAGGAAGMVAIWAVVASRPEPMERLVGWIAAPLPTPVAAALSAAAPRFVAGLGVMRQAGLLVSAAAWSVALWVVIAASLWLVAVSFGIQIPAAGAGALLVLVAVGAAVPTPGGIGGYHAAYQAGVIGLYAASNEAAVGAGILAHAVSFLPVTVIGIMLMAREGVRLGRITEMVDGETMSSRGVDGETMSSRGVDGETMSSRGVDGETMSSPAADEAVVMPRRARVGDDGRAG